MAVYNIEGCQDSCYPGTTVLVNKLNIRDQEYLTNAESILVTSCSTKVEKYMKFQKVDFEFYKNIHKQIFGDLYEWAGQLRKINISKRELFFVNIQSLKKSGN